MNSSDFNYTPTFPGILKQALANGYNLLHATLEFTDNSISKNTSNLQVILEKTDTKPNLLDRITVFDDGNGMTSQGLKESFVIANNKSSREENDIGSFCVGMKYAAMNLGSKITIISKTEGSNIVGLHADIEQMRINNTFRPTEFCSSVDDEWSMKYLSPGLFDKFKTVSHGTMIHISSLRSKSAINYETAIDELKKGLTVAYSSLYNNCIMTLYDGSLIHSTINPIDMFYNSSPENLDKDAYETNINIYRGSNGSERVIEINTMRRIIATKKYTSGRPETPSYIEWFNKETPKGRKSIAPKILKKEDLPHKNELIGSITTRTIQVKQEPFIAEKKYFPEGTPLYRDRKRIWFHRDIRCVAASNAIGKKFDDRVSTNAERQRTHVKFSSSLDETIGSKFNKQMDNKELPCRLLGDVIFDIHRKVTNEWNLDWKEDTTVPSQDDRSDEEDEEDETPSPPSADTNPFIKLYETAKVKQPVVTISEANVEKQFVTIPEVDVEEQYVTIPVIEKDSAIINEPHEEVSDTTELEIVTKEVAFQNRFGITLERYSEMSQWLKEYDSI
jgi:hypothetical protein